MYESKFHEVAATSDFPVAIVGNLATNEFTLVSLGASDDYFTGVYAEAVAKGLTQFIGVSGIVNGEPRVALKVELDADTTELLGAAYAECLNRFVEASEVELLKRMHSLPDTRVN